MKYSARSRYHRIRVEDRGGRRFLRFDNMTQTVVDGEEGLTSVFLYIDYFHISLALQPEARSALLIGLGGGVLPHRMWKDYPDLQLQVVEIDPLVVEVAYRFFQLPDHPRLEVVVADGAEYIRAAAGKRQWDLILVDVYDNQRIPPECTILPFYRAVDQCLAPDGVAAFNIIGSLEGEDSWELRTICRTLQEVWPVVFVFAVGWNQDRDPRAKRNLMVLVSRTAFTPERLADRIRSRGEGMVAVKGFEGFIDDLYTGPLRLQEVPVRTAAE